MGGLIFFFVQYYVVQMVKASENVDLSVKMGASIVPHAAMSFATEVFITFEVNNLLNLIQKNSRLIF